MAKMQYYTINTYVKTLEEKGMLVDCRLYDKCETQITTLTYDSREVTTGTAFVCKGAAFKAEYLQDAMEKGAVLYISEKAYDVAEAGEIPYILVKDIRRAMPVLANLFYNKPWEDLTVIGVGGTKGKSTSAYYMKAVVDDYMAAQKKKESAIISGIDIYDGTESFESHITTPESMELQQRFRNALNSGIEYVEMEVSSQALKYNRVDEMRFDVGIFLNISEDHISPIEHDDFEDYFTSKMKMFEKTKIAVINLDSDCSDRVREAAKAAETVATISQTDPRADFYAYDIHKEDEKVVFFVKHGDVFDEEFVLTMPGFFNVENALGVIAAATMLKIPRKYIHSGLFHAKSSGRMELYTNKDKNIVAIVDYAHNKLSFEKLFSSMKEEYPEYSIVSVFGCPGKKALTRRRDLGTVAGQYSKKVYLASEDPGYEPVEKISREIAKYVKAQGCPYEMINDRGEAIKAAIESAEGKTLLLITGKGNETREKIGGEYIDSTSDVEYVKRYLAEYDKKTKP
ncbi:MAG: UDP-N-acetylmuramoyl-L-alanyl-D-glutamate--2,6-diaminopimelate ligase [Bacillota bacterium]|nr:UDP-N-acetylmuramoyl-L-alanyl-D-glutamate--2,6-diaminopimelate ligase [Bacillota bacterium]